MPVRRHDAEAAVVEVDVVVLIHQAQVVGAMRKCVREDQVHVLGIPGHDLLKQLQREAGEIHGFAGHRAEPRSVFGG